MYQVEIDAHSGFCGGVIRAIGQAEDYLTAHPGEQLLSLGSIVHNEAELERLRAKGLQTLSSLEGADGRTVLFTTRDGWCLDPCGMDARGYALLLAARWAQMVGGEDELASLR